MQIHVVGEGRSAIGTQCCIACWKGKQCAKCSTVNVHDRCLEKIS